MNRKLLSSAVAVVALAISAIAALALNVDQNRQVPARLLATNQVHYYRLTINYNDPRISTAQKFGRLPSNAYINRVTCHVTTVFNANSTNVVTIGTSTAANELVDAATSNGSIDESSATFQSLTAAPGLGLKLTSAGEVDLYAKYAQTGTPAATAGSVTCVIQFVPNNDL